MRRTVKWMLAQVPDLRITIEAIVGEGDTVVARVLSEGTNLAALNLGALIMESRIPCEHSSPTLLAVLTRQCKFCELKPGVR